MAFRRKFPDVSLVLAFGDCEETIGHVVGSAAAHLSALGQSFEIVAVNEGSRDNSLAVLELLRARHPQLSVVCRDASGRAFGRGVVEVSGSKLMFLRCPEAPAVKENTVGALWAPLGWVLGRVDAGRDAVILRGRYVVCQRKAAMALVAGIHGASDRFESGFERQAQGLKVEVVGNRGSDNDNAFERLRAALLAPIRRFASNEGR